LPEISTFARLFEKVSRNGGLRVSGTGVEIIIKHFHYMRNFEVTFIVDPVLSGDEVKATAQKYVDQLQENNCEIVHVDEMGLRRLATTTV